MSCVFTITNCAIDERSGIQYSSIIQDLNIFILYSIKNKYLPLLIWLFVFLCFIEEVFIDWINEKLISNITKKIIFILIFSFLVDLINSEWNAFIVD